MKGSHIVAVTVSNVAASLVESSAVVVAGLNGIVLDDNVDVSVDKKDPVSSCAFINAKRKKCKFFIIIAKGSQNAHFAKAKCKLCFMRA